MISPAHISLYLDTRRPKGKGLYPVKLRVYTKSPRKQKLYTTKFTFTKEEFSSIWETSKPRKEYKLVRMELQEIENNALTIAETLTTFTFEAFEQKLLGTAHKTYNAVLLYQQKIKDLNKYHQFSSENLYYLTIRSLLLFQYAKIKRQPLENFPKQEAFRTAMLPWNIDVREISPSWLKDFEEWFIKDQGKSIATLGIYLRTLRTVYNSLDHLEPDFYPFGSKRYQIPEPKGVKKALNRDRIKELFYIEPKTPEQAKAKAFWFFSYACNGMNIKDIAQLRYHNIDNDTLTFFRAKSARTTKEPKPIVAFLTDKTKAIIAEYGLPPTGPKQLIFSIINDNQTPKEQYRSIKNFIKFVNDHMKSLATTMGISIDISSGWARHSFSTNTIRMGKNIAFVSEAMGHSSIKTTENYFAGFEDEERKNFSKELMDF